jgi:hypothetical protein
MEKLKKYIRIMWMLLLPACFIYLIVAGFTGHLNSFWAGIGFGLALLNELTIGLMRAKIRMMEKENELLRKQNM